MAIKNGVGMLFECKAWEKSCLSFEKEKIALLNIWRINTSMQLLFAWRMNGEGWFFIKPEELSETNMAFVVTKKRALEINRRLEHII